MSRVAAAQSDLFAPVQPDLFVPSEPQARSAPLDPVSELRALLDKVQSAAVLPWTDAAAAMVEEHRVLWLAQQGGDEGARLAAAIFVETERLFSAAELGLGAALAG
jgi:hypothetical protein